MKTTKIASRERIKDAARSVLNDGRAAEPYNHDEVMRKYRENHKNNFSG